MGLPAEDQQLGQYVIDEKIAQGGMAEIFKGRAIDPGGLERPVVIKRILPQIAADEDFVEMLVQEAKLAVQLSHGNIAQVFDLGRIDDDYFMVMEYVDGESLSRIARHLRQNNEWMPVPIALYIISEVANGLTYMHQKTDSRGNPLNIVHRDISPQNVIISWSGTVKIIDFGIAKATSQVSTTDSGVVKGKFAYMSPEHVGGEKLDGRTDIFSLAVILWELLTNQRLFKGKNNRETIQRVKRCRVPSAQGYREDIPKEVDKILKKALTKNKKNRYQSAHDFQLDLIRTLVQRYPDFAPRNLQDYLNNLFADRADEEPTIVGQTISQEAPTIVDNEMEVTALADPRILQRRLTELETYNLNVDKADDEASAPDEAPEPEEPAPTPQRKPFPWRQWLGRIPWRRMILNRWVLIGVLLATLAYAGYKVAPHVVEYFHSEPAPEPPVTQPKPIKIVSPPKPVPTPVPKPTPPVAEFGTLLIRSQPAGARIFINDRDTGLQTPAELEKLKLGQTYNIGLFLKNHTYWAGKAQVSGDTPTTIEAELRINYGALRITSQPPKARIFIDGIDKGTSPLRLPRLQPGSEHTIRVELPGYRTWEQTVKIFAGKTSVIRATLRK